MFPKELFVCQNFDINLLKLGNNIKSRKKKWRFVVKNDKTFL